MSWITPKTNWAVTDKFNASDFNRIAGNIEAIIGKAETFYTSFGEVKLASKVRESNGTSYYMLKDITPSNMEVVYLTSDCSPLEFSQGVAHNLAELSRIYDLLDGGNYFSYPQQLNVSCNPYYDAPNVSVYTGYGFAYDVNQEPAREKWDLEGIGNYGYGLSPYLLFKKEIKPIQGEPYNYQVTNEDALGNKLLYPYNELRALERNMEITYDLN